MATARNKNVKKRVKTPQMPTVVPSDDMLPSPNMSIQKEVINSLPNEMLRTILAKLEINKLIGIRRVCTRWQGLAEHICHEKRSILIESKGQNIPEPGLSGSFNGLVDFSQGWTALKVKPINDRPNVIALTSDLCVLLRKLFPQVESLLLNVSLERSTDTADSLFTLLEYWSSTLVGLSFYIPRRPNLSTVDCIDKSRYPALFDRLNNLTRLKRLAFGNPLAKYKLDFLTRLEHASFSLAHLGLFRNSPGSLDPISLLGPNCTSLRLLGYTTPRQITQFPKLNAPLVKRLTHLRLRVEDADEKDVWSFVCANFGALQMLEITISMAFDPNAIADLARLSNLSHLSIAFVFFDLYSLAQSNNLPTLSSVHILELTNFVMFEEGDQPFGERFCRVLAMLFPNLQQLTIKHRAELVRTAIGQHLAHFVHLRQHVISSN